jgi:hypothetical protein
VRDCRNSTLGIPFGVHDTNVGQFLLVEEESLLIAHAIAWSILLESGTLLSLLDIWCHSAMRNPAVNAGSGPWLTDPLRLLAGGGIVSHHQAGECAVFCFGVGCGFGFSLSCSLCFGCCSSWWHFSGRVYWVVSVCGAALRCPQSIIAVISLSFTFPS